MTYPDVSLSELVSDLAKESDLLGTFDSGDPGAGVEAVFSWSYRSLSPQAARTFRLCGLHPGPDVTVEAVASLIAESRPVAARALSELAIAHFLEEYRPGRFRFHDLLQAYAVKRATAEDAQLKRRAALGRVLDHYLHTAFAADRQLYPYRHPIDLGPPAAGVLLPTFADATAAVAWFRDEIATFPALTEYAAGNGWDTHAWQLPWAFATFLHRQGPWHDYVVSQEQGLAAAYRGGDPAAIARCERNVGRPYTLLGRTNEAGEHFTLSLRMCRELGDVMGEALCEDALTWLWGRHQRHADAIEHAERALVIYTRIDNRSGRARALNSIGWNQGRLGNYTEVLKSCTEALQLFRSEGNQVGEADTLDSIGYAYAHVGRLDEAVSSYEASVRLWRLLGDRYNVADLLTRLGDIHRSQGNVEDARTAWTEALAIFTELDVPDIEVVQARLDELGPGPVPTIQQ
jgi:tetratricopeptide (TPR) repeat protein